MNNDGNHDVERLQAALRAHAKSVLHADAHCIAECATSILARLTEDGLREAREATGLDVERLATIVSDSLAAATEGTDYAEAPPFSDEPRSPYVLRLTNEIAVRLTLARSTPDDLPQHQPKLKP